MLKNNKQLIKSSYDSLTPYVPGRDADALAKDLRLQEVIKLASNENPLGPSPKALEAAANCLQKCYRYPDSHARYLRARLAEKYSVDVQRIIIGSGADSLIHAIAQTFITPGDEVVISEFAFASYEIATKANEGNPILVPAKNFAHDLEQMQKAITQKTKLIFLANPNNPTGTYFNQQRLKNFLMQVPSDVLVILDEAYYEYIESNEQPSNLKILNEFSNLIILRTFSKAYGLAGFRVGYAFADESLIELMNRIRSPFTITVASLAAATAALDDTSFLERTLAHNRDAREYFTQALAELHLQNISHMGNFVTVDFAEQSHTIFQTLLSKGIILRPLKNYKMDNYLRITLGLKRELDCVINELKQLL